MLSDLDVECNDGMYFSPSEGNLTKNPEDYFKYQKGQEKHTDHHRALRHSNVAS